jgi:hypothetical protein
MDYASSSANYDFQDNVELVTNIHPSAVPAAPTDLHAISPATSTVSLQWAPVADSTLQGYNVYRASSVTGTYTLLTTGTPITATSFTDTSAPNGTTSYYKVTAVDSTAGAESLGDIAPMAVPAVVVAGSGTPVVTSQSVNTQAGIAVTINELSTATDSTGIINVSTVLISTNPTNGTVTINQSNGAITYTPAAGFAGTDTFQYTVGDNTGAVSAPATITVSVIAQAVGNPVVANLSETVVAGRSITINDVADATDTTGTLLAATVDPTTGAITYTANAGFVGVDSIQYTISDNLQAVSNTGTITITVTAPPAVLTAANLAADTVQGTAVTINDVAAATDPSGTIVPSSVAITQTPNHGTATVDPTTGAITYTPAAGFTGTDTLQYTVGDSVQAVSAAATITITVTSPPMPITAANLSVSTVAGVPVTIDDVAAAVDPNGVLLPSSVQITQQPAHGTATVNPTTGVITYTPAVTFSGTDTIIYTLADSSQAAAPATITITVTARPTNPIAATLTSTTLANGSATVNVISSATAGINPLQASSVAITTGPANGTASINTSTGSITYTPDSNFVGVDTLQYTVADTAGAVSSPATLTFSVGVTVNSTTAKSLTYTDGNGNKITVALVGGGTAQVLFDGSGTSQVIKGPRGSGTLLITGSNLAISGISATGTKITSALNITHRGSGTITVGDITTDGSLGSLSAPFANLTGDLTVNGVLRTLNIGSATGASVSAQQILSLTTRGNFDAALTTTNTTASPFSLGTVRIGGQIGADAWLIAGNVGSIVTGSVASGWTASFAKKVNALTIRSGGFAGVLTAGSIGTLSIVGNDTGKITAGSIQSMRIVGSLTGGSLKLTNAEAARVLDLGHLAVTGATTDSQVISAGNIGSITTAGLAGSSIEAGTAAGVTLPSSSANFSSPAAISAIQIVGRGATFGSSDIAAQTIGSLSLGKVITANGNTAFGIGAGTVASLLATLDTAGVLHLNRTQLASTASVAAYIASKGFTTNEFTIRSGL